MIQAFCVFFALCVSNMCLLSPHVLPLYLYSLATAFMVIPCCILYNYLHSLFQPHLAIPDKNLVFVLCSSCISLKTFLLWLAALGAFTAVCDLFGGRLVRQSCRVLLWPLQPLNGYLGCSWSCSSFGQVPSFSFLAVHPQEIQDFNVGNVFSVLLIVNWCTSLASVKSRFG